MKKTKNREVRKSTENEGDPLDRDLSYLMKEKGKWLKFSDLFQMQTKNKTITLRVSEDLLNQIKKIAQKEDTNYQKIIRDLLIEYVAKKAS